MRTSMGESRRGWCRLALLAATAALLAPTVRGAYLEGDGAVATHRDAEPERILPPPPRPDDDNPALRLLARVSVGAPAWYRGLALFPLVYGGSGGALRPLTLDESLRRGDLSIQEEPDGRVSGIRVRNRSDRHVFLMSGEYLSGGKQNRIVREDVLLAPGARDVVIPVYCGERDRWSQTPLPFSSRGLLAGNSIRGLSARASAQGEVWSEIDRKMADAGVQSPTRSYEALHDSPGVRRDLDAAVEGLRRCLRPSTVGVVAVAGYRVLGCDLFADPRLLENLWDKICRSYAVECDRDGRGADAFRERPPLGAVETFLSEVRSARFSYEGTPGEGRRLALGGSVSGAALIWNGELVHLGAFPPAFRPPEPEPVPVPYPGPHPFPHPRPPYIPYLRNDGEQPGR